MLITEHDNLSIKQTQICFRLPYTQNRQIDKNICIQ